MAGDYLAELEDYLKRKGTTGYTQYDKNGVARSGAGYAQGNLGIGDTGAYKDAQSQIDLLYRLGDPSAGFFSQNKGYTHPLFSGAPRGGQLVRGANGILQFADQAQPAQSTNRSTFGGPVAGPGGAPPSGGNYTQPGQGGGGFQVGGGGFQRGGRIGGQVDTGKIDQAGQAADEVGGSGWRQINAGGTQTGAVAGPGGGGITTQVDQFTPSQPPSGGNYTTPGGAAPPGRVGQTVAGGGGMVPRETGGMMTPGGGGPAVGGGLFGQQPLGAVTNRTPGGAPPSQGPGDTQGPGYKNKQIYTGDDGSAYNPAYHKQPPPLSIPYNPANGSPDQQYYNMLNEASQRDTPYKGMNATDMTRRAFNNPNWNPPGQGAPSPGGGGPNPQQMQMMQQQQMQQEQARRRMQQQGGGLFGEPGRMLPLGY